MFTVLRILLKVALLLACLYFAGIQTATKGIADDKDVPTQHNDSMRSGHYTSETVLNPSTMKNFGFQFDMNLQDPSEQIYAQPLYVSNLLVPLSGIKNVIFVVTEKNRLYAFDADRGGNAWAPLQLAPLQLAPPASPTDFNGSYQVITQSVGVTSTPVIDRERNRIFVVAASQTGKSCDTIKHTIYSIDMSYGEIKSQRTITLPSTITIPSTGGGSINGVLPFSPCHHLNRAALLLQGDTVYVAFTGAYEWFDYHGWVFGFSADTLAPVGAPYVVNPNGDGGGIWQSGNGLAGDGTAIYLATGNGGDDTTGRYLGAADARGSSVIKLGAGLQELDFFSPHNQKCSGFCDLDLSTCGPCPPSRRFAPDCGGQGRANLYAGYWQFREGAGIGQCRQPNQAVLPSYYQYKIMRTWPKVSN